MSRPIAVIVSDPTKLPDKGDRSSGNFSTKWYGNSESMLITVVDNDTKHINNDIEFDIFEQSDKNDKKRTDTPVKNGSVIDFMKESDLYIGNPKKATHEFTVTFLPYNQ